MKKGYEKSEALVLYTTDYGESDRVVTFYTRGEGRLTGIAKGARRSLKRFVGKLDPPALLTIHYFKGGRRSGAPEYGSPLARVEGAELIDGFPSLKADPWALGRACSALELTREMTREGQENPEYFELVSGFLSMLERAHNEGPGSADPVGVDKAADAFLCFFELKALSVLGFLPHLGGCVVCRSEVAPVGGGNDNTNDNKRGNNGGVARGPKAFFSSARGGVVCIGCAPAVTETIALAPGTAALLGMAERLPLEKLRRLRPSPTALVESERVLTDFIRFQLGKELKTKKFMAKISTGTYTRAPL